MVRRQRQYRTANPERARRMREQLFNVQPEPLPVNPHTQTLANNLQLANQMMGEEDQLRADEMWLLDMKRSTKRMLVIDPVPDQDQGAIAYKPVPPPQMLPMNRETSTGILQPRRMYQDPPRRTVMDFVRNMFSSRNRIIPSNIE